MPASARRALSWRFLMQGLEVKCGGFDLGHLSHAITFLENTLSPAGLHGTVPANLSSAPNGDGHGADTKFQ